MKSLSKLLFLGLLGGIVGSYFFNVITDRNSANVSGAVVSAPIVSATPSPGMWQSIVTKLSPSFVGIQAFSNDRALRQGSGIIVSSDGLIVTTADLATPKGTVYQIFYENTVLQATVVSVDSKINLMLLKTSSLDSNIAELHTSSDSQSGQEVVLIGKIFDLSKLVVASQRGTIGYATDKLVILDTNPNPYLYGFGAADSDGKLQGLAYLRTGKVFLIPANLIETFFKSYIEKSTK